MAMARRVRARRLVLDIGASAIRLCELTATKTGYQISRYYQREVVLDPQLDELAKNEVRNEALRDLLKTAKIRTRKVILAVPGRSVFTRSRPLPPVQESKLTQIVQYEIQQQIPFGLDQIALDYQVLARTDAGGYDVMMAAIKVDVVDKALEVLRDARRQIDTVDVTPFASYNWAKTIGEFGTQGECVALIDMGASTTELVVEREGQFRFTRPLNVGGNDVTSALALAFGVSFPEAEALKRERAFAPTGDAARDGKGGEAVGKVLTKLVSEITRSFNFFRSQPGGGSVNRVLITGGGSRLRNIIPFLQRQLQMEVKQLNVLQGLQIAPGATDATENADQAAVVLGLALRCWQSVPIEINLVPPRILEGVKRREQVFYMILSMATFALIMASVIPVSSNENKLVLKQIETTKQFIQRYDPQAAMNPDAASAFAGQLEQAKQKVERRRSQVNILDAVRSKRRFWVDPLMALAESRPTGGKIWFSSVQSVTITPDAKNAQIMNVAPFAGIGSGAVAVDAANSPGGRGGGRGGKPQQTQQGNLPNPNGMSVFGYGKDPQAVMDFVAELKRRVEFGEGNVIFNEATVERVPLTELQNAKVMAVRGPSPSGGGGERGDRGDRGNALSGLGGLGGVPAPQAQNTPMADVPAGDQVVSFRVDLKFAEMRPQQ